MTCIIEYETNKYLADLERMESEHDYFNEQVELYLDDIERHWDNFCPLPFLLAEYTEYLWNDREELFELDEFGEAQCKTTWQDYLVQEVPHQKYYTQLKRIMPSLSESDRAFLGDYLGNGV